MKFVFLFLLFFSSLAYADKYSEALKNRDLSRDLKFKQGYSNLREEYQGFEQNEMEERPVQAVEEEPQSPQISPNMPAPASLPSMQGMTKEQATEMGRAIKKAQEAGLPVPTFNIPK